MSTNLTTAKTDSEDVPNVKVTDFSGNAEDGQMIQLHTGFGVDADIIQLTEGQVDSILTTLTEWKIRQLGQRRDRAIT